MAKKATYTDAVIELFARHEREALQARKRPYDRYFPLWVGLRGAGRSASSRIDRLMKGVFRYPFSTYWEAKEEIAHRIVGNKPITTLQFNLIDGYLCQHGYYSAHRPVCKLTPPDSAIPVGRCDTRYGEDSIVAREVDDWFYGVILMMEPEVTLRAILDPMLTDLILSQALEITAKQAKAAKKREPARLGMT